MTPVSASPAGTRLRYFGDYELISEIARGGMGVVYKARQVNLNRIVALKMILSGQLASDEDIRRFHTEAESAAHLDHPGIVPIHEIGEHDGQHYFSMGFVDGKSLADRVKDGPLPPQEAASLTRKISEAIAYAHEKGVIHRDLKPANVLLDAGGEPKVTDFGLARKLEQDSGLTRTGAVMGTPSYMPPEQAAGETDKVGPLADVYSLGAMLYCLLTGRPPFQAANPLDTLLQVMEREPIAPTELAPTIPKDLETICLKCLQKDRLKRYESANDLAADIGRWEHGEPIRARAVTRTERVYRWIKRNRIVSGLLAATAVGFVLATGFGIQALREATKARNAERQATELGQQARNEAANARAAELQAKTAEQQARDAERKSKQAEQQARTSEVTAVASQEQTEATLARSNYFLARARWDDNRVGEALQLLQSVPKKHRNIEWYLARRLCDQTQFSCYGHTGKVFSVSFSPDGTLIASGSEDQTIKIWDASTGTELATLTGHILSVLSVSFSPDGTLIASGSSDGTIKIWDASTGTELATLKGNLTGRCNVSFSPDGTRIASGSEDNTIRIWDVSTGTEITTVNGHTVPFSSVGFSPDGARIASGDGFGTIKIWDASTGTEINTLKGHESWVSSVSFSPEGTRIASGCDDKTVKIWDASTGTELTTLKGHKSEVTSVSFSPDGTRIASGSQDNTIKIWDASTGKELATLKTNSVSSVSFSPDGTRIASGSEDQTIKIWDASTDTEINTFKGHTDSVDSVSFSPDGTRIASGSGDQTIKIWGISTGTELTTLKGHNFSVSSVSFSPNGTQIASGDGFGTIKIWDASTGTEIMTTKGHTSTVRSLSFSPDGTRIVSGSDDNAIKILDASTGTELTTLKGHEYAVSSVSFSPDGTRIASGSGDNTIKIWDTSMGTELTTLTGHTRDVPSVSFSPDGTRIASGSGDNTIKIWDTSTGTEINTLKGHNDSVSSVSFSRDGTRIASGSDDGTIKIWDASTGTELITLEGHTSEVTSVLFSPDGTCIASGSNDQTIKIWDASTGTELNTLKGETEGVSTVSFSPDGTRIASGSNPGGIGEIKIWDASTGTELNTLKGHESWVSSLIFSPDGTRIASGDGGGTIKIWDASTGTELTTLKGHEYAVSSVSFSPDGARVASGNYDKTVKIWDASTGMELTTLKGHEGWVSSVSFSPDGTRIASGSVDRTVKIWDVSMGTEVTTLMGHTSEVSSVIFSRDGTRLLSQARDGEELFWDIRAGNVLTDGRVEEFAYGSDSDKVPDGQWLTVPYGKNVLLVDLAYKDTPREKLRRETQARPKPRWHREQSLAAQSAMQWYPSTFHLAWLLKINPADGWAYDDLYEAHRKLMATNNGQAPPLPSIVSEMLQQPRGSELPQLTDDSVGSLYAELWNLVKAPAINEIPRVSTWHLQRMQDICSRYPQSANAKTTLGVLQYRLGQCDAAIETLRKSLETSAGEIDPSGPDPAALAFLAMCHHQLGQTEPATKFRQQLNEAVRQDTGVLNPSLQTILVEVQSVFDGADSVRAEATLDDFNREAGFEGLSQHRWRFWPNANTSYPFAVSVTNPHAGRTCLSIQAPSSSTVMAHQSVTVLPQSRYRLMGWIRTQDVVSNGLEPNAADGVSIGMLPVDESEEWTSEKGSVPIVGTTEWTQVTFDFQTGDATTMQLGCRSRNCTGTAWFDDLHLEKVE